MTEHHPQVTPVSCWMLDCADCGADWMDGHDFHIHFPSAQEAEQQAVDVYDFVRTGDNTLLCPECAKKLKCAATGHHDWSAWCRAGGESGVRYRWCEVCDETDRQAPVPADLPPTTCCGHQHAGPELGGICVGCACGVTT